MEREVAKQNRLTNTTREKRKKLNKAEYAKFRKKTVESLKSNNKVVSSFIEKIREVLPVLPAKEYKFDNQPFPHPKKKTADFEKIKNFIDDKPKQFQRPPAIYSNRNAIDYYDV